MKEKVYDNKKLEKMLNRSITERRYGGFKPLLHEIFQRKAYEFRLDEQQMKKEIRNFVKKIKGIKFGKNMLESSEDNLLVYKMYGYIFFNCDTLDKMIDQIEGNFWLKLYAGLTHEVYHVNANNGETIGLYNMITETGLGKHEIFNETAASRTSFIRTSQDDENDRMETNGYVQITFVVNLLAAAFNLEEREILKAGIQNAEELEKVLKQNLSQEDYKKDILPHLQKLDENLDLIYDALFENKEKSHASEEIASNFEQIFCEIMDLFKENILKSNREIDEPYMEELAYQYTKIFKIIEDTICDTDSITKNRAEEMVQNKILPQKDECCLKISDMIHFSIIKSELKEHPLLPKLEVWAKQGSFLEHLDEIKKYGIIPLKELEEREQLIHGQSFQYRQRPDWEFRHPTQWDNAYVTEIMQQLWDTREVVDVVKFEEEMNSKISLQKIKDFFVRWKSKKLKKLAGTSKSYQDLENDLDKRYKLSQEDLTPLKSQENLRNPNSNQERE